ncbi:flagellar basal body L-ring protein FlgH [Vibrio sp. V27_P1S3P104]|uniref:flagellar basal body L-ring protein FlgH n=1 Tax=unclassified Vibrio TaxID=2614977 RepID=UPI00137244B5|nr:MULTISPECIES: flagellar basal body L-ring protein FlgH [unclassified Vibrio]NAW70645.1 flagellar basal body L-ring protein FlgH [Vibrio sp. V28_P6S34P95]NAX05086.1 flagellar basal body L-ring protein FlgH [Vibrio sp. V30_P3S12P165]NAX35543.1 flagellar basal body L-ring protein FlgH [Vibrio sp. V29_P1S30P107]NAX38936.1 flagellar basal body L-ring protein FlgH [Vibrio sp. V27_P1S3P104]NAX41614.1 flagellar basal body L-ring protein FlgH [Vibrio sp. V26_P1S5P106]
MKIFSRAWVVGALLLVGCSGLPELVPPSPNSEEYAPPKLDYTLPEAKSGSLYRHQYTMTLFQDRRAYRVGDILTVLLSEETESSKKAGTQFGKKSGVNLGMPTIGGKVIDELGVSIDGNRSFDGSASSSQGNKLQGAITVTVHEVLPNGVLRISGEKWLRLNQGDEFIRLMGIIRVDDISRSNQVSSKRIGDARITYSGRGSLADSNASGWLTRFFNSPWVPF